MIDGISCLQPVPDNEPFFKTAALDGHLNMLTEAEALVFSLEQSDPNWEEFGSLENVDRYLEGISPPLAEEFQINASLFMEVAEFKVIQARNAHQKMREAMGEILDSPFLLPFKIFVAPLVGLVQMSKTMAAGAEIAGTPGVVVGYPVGVLAEAYKGMQFTFNTSDLLLGNDPNACLSNP